MTNPGKRFANSAPAEKELSKPVPTALKRPRTDYFDQSPKKAGIQTANRKRPTAPRVKVEPYCEKTLSSAEKET
jgi:hypothetical protein